MFTRTTERECERPVVITHRSQVTLQLIQKSPYSKVGGRDAGLVHQNPRRDSWLCIVMSKLSSRKVANPGEFSRLLKEKHEATSSRSRSDPGYYPEHRNQGIDCQSQRDDWSQSRISFPSLAGSGASTRLRCLSRKNLFI